MRAALVAFALLLNACASAPPAPLPPGAQAILVTVETDTRAALAGAPSRLLGYAGAYRRTPAVERVLAALSSDYGLERVDAWPIASLGVYCQVFALPKDRAEAVLAALARDSRVESAQLMNEFETLNSDDPYRALQTSLEPLAIRAAHRLSTGRDVTVAVIDTHIDRRHPDLAGRIARQETVLPRAYNTPDAHGTGIAGVIAARGGNGEGIVGVAPDADLLALTACWHVAERGGRCNSFTLAQALDRALRHGADIINLSLTGPPDPLLARLLERAQARGAVIVGARDPQGGDAFPCGVEGVISVAASADGRGGVAAPGSEVLTTVPGGGYDFLSGNSLAAAHVSGVVALALAADPSLSGHALRARLEKSSHPATGINACAALDGLNGRQCQVLAQSD